MVEPVIMISINKKRRVVVIGDCLLSGLICSLNPAHRRCVSSLEPR